MREFETVPATALASGVAEVRGLAAEYFDNPNLQGSPRLTRTDTRMDFRWTLNSPGRGIPFDWYSARWTGTITAPATGVARIGVEGNDGYRLYLDGQLVIDNWKKQSFGRRIVSVGLKPGARHPIRLEYFETTGNARLRLIWDAGVVDDSRAAIERAVALAKTSDVAVIVAGVEEGEFRDRAKLGLPGRQPELIEAVAATGKPVIVVTIGGSAITMPTRGSSSPKTVTASTMVTIGFQTIAPIGSPPSVSMVSALNRMMRPRITMMMLSSSGK